MNENWNAKHDEREFEGKYTHSAQHTPGKRKNRHFHHYRHLLSTFDQKMSKRTQNYQVFVCVCGAALQNVKWKLRISNAMLIEVPVDGRKKEKETEKSERERKRGRLRKVPEWAE